MPVTWADKKLILLYCPGRGSNSRPSAHRSFKHGQGPMPLPTRPRWRLRVSYPLHLLILGSCSHKRIVNIIKVFIERNNIQVELIRFRKNIDFIDVGNFEVGIYFRDCVYEIGLIATHDVSPLFCAGGTGRFGI